MLWEVKTPLSRELCEGNLSKIRLILMDQTEKSLQAKIRSNLISVLTMICNQGIPPLFASHSFYQWLCRSDSETHSRKQADTKQKEAGICQHLDVNNEFSEKLILVIRFFVGLSYLWSHLYKTNASNAASKAATAI